jgi:hypothetical protein
MPARETCRTRRHPRYAAGHHQSFARKGYAGDVTALITRGFPYEYELRVSGQMGPEPPATRAHRILSEIGGRIVFGPRIEDLIARVVGQQPKESRQGSARRHCNTSMSSRVIEAALILAGAFG